MRLYKHQIYTTYYNIFLKGFKPFVVDQELFLLSEPSVIFWYDPNIKAWRVKFD